MGNLYPNLKDIFEAINPISEAVSHIIKLLKMSREGFSATSVSLFVLNSCLCKFSLGV